MCKVGAGADRGAILGGYEAVTMGHFWRFCVKT